MKIHLTKLDADSIQPFIQSIKNQNLEIEIDEISDDTLIDFFHHMPSNAVVTLSIKKILHTDEWKQTKLISAFLDFLNKNKMTLSELECKDLTIYQIHTKSLDEIFKENIMLKRLDVTFNTSEKTGNSHHVKIIRRNRELFYTYTFLTDELIKGIKPHYPNVNDIEGYLATIKQNDKLTSLELLSSKVVALHLQILKEAPELKSVIELLYESKFHTHYLFSLCYAGKSPLYYIIQLDIPYYLQKLIQYGASLTGKDSVEINALRVAEENGSVNNLQYLLANHSHELKAQISDTTSLCLAVINHNEATVNLLKTKAHVPFHKDEVILARRLFYVLGGKKLNDIFSTKNSIFDGEGGYSTEAIETLIIYLNRFAHKINDKNQKKIISEFAHWLESESQSKIKIDASLLNPKSFIEFLRFKYYYKIMYIQSIIDQLKNGGAGTVKLIRSGFIGHSIYCTIKNCGNHLYQLIISERGPMRGNQFPTFTFASGSVGKYRGLRRLFFNEAQLGETITLLHLAHISWQNQAEQILFDHIPKMTNSQFDYLPIHQSAYKTGICYFANIKSLICEKFTFELGPSLGKQFYKNFTIFMSEETVKDSAKIFGSDHVHIKTGTKITEDKKKKYSALLMQSVFCQDDSMTEKSVSINQSTVERKGHAVLKS